VNGDHIQQVATQVKRGDRYLKKTLEQINLSLGTSITYANS